MGPRSVDRGRLDHPLTNAESLKLQWGHDQLIVEGFSPIFLYGVTILLQWGHDQLIVEGSQTSFIGLGLNRLQWGHDQLIVEGRKRRPKACGIFTPLQWGHDQLIVEGCSRINWLAEQGLASMGPRSVDRGRRCGFLAAKIH